MREGGGELPPGGSAQKAGPEKEEKRSSSNLKEPVNPREEEGRIQRIKE